MFGIFLDVTACKQAKEAREMIAGEMSHRVKNLFTIVSSLAALAACEREQPGELIHIDIKKLGRTDGVGHRITGYRAGQSNRRGAGCGLGWEYLQVATDDRSRLAYTQVLASERQEDATAFLLSSLARSASTASPSNAS